MVTYTGQLPRGFLRFAGRAGIARVVRGGADERQARERNHEVDPDGHVRRERHVVRAQKIEARQQAAEHGARDVAAVEEAEPGDAGRRRLDPARNGRKRRAHEQRRR
jgi:hypothetical protein